MRSTASSISETADPQQTLPVGPTGVIHRGGGGAPWHKRLALTKAPSPTAHHVLLTLGSFVTDGQSDAWPSVATLASMTGLSRRAVQTALRALENASIITNDTVGRSSRYRLVVSTCAPAAPPPAHLLRPPCAPPAPEVLSEVLKGSTAADASTNVTQEVQPPLVQPTALLLPTNTSKKGNDDEKPKTDELTGRYTCKKCGHSWPKRFKTTCFECQTRVGASHHAGGDNHHAGLAAPEPGKYDFLDTVDSSNELSTQADAPRPDPPPMKPETRIELEANARANGFHRIGGKWMKLL